MRKVRLFLFPVRFVLFPSLDSVSASSESIRVQKVNENKKGSKRACCARGKRRKTREGAGRCGVETLLEIRGVLTFVVGFLVESY